MPTDPYRSIILSDDQLSLVVEGLEMLRYYTQGFPDTEGILKLKEVERLDTRLRKRQVTRKQGANGNFAEKL